MIYKSKDRKFKKRYEKLSMYPEKFAPKPIEITQNTTHYTYSNIIVHFTSIELLCL